MGLNNEFYHGVTPISFLTRNKVSRLRKPGYHPPHPHVVSEFYINFHSCIILSY